MHPLILLIVAAAAAASPLVSAAQPGPGSGAPASRTCKAEPVQSFVGREATPQVLQEARRLSGSKTVRVIRPGQVVTMEFNPSRLTVEVDGANRIVALRCG